MRAEHRRSKAESSNICKNNAQTMAGNLKPKALTARPDVNLPKTPRPKGWWAERFTVVDCGGGKDSSAASPEGTTFCTALKNMKASCTYWLLAADCGTRIGRR